MLLNNPIQLTEICFWKTSEKEKKFLNCYFFITTQFPYYCTYHKLKEKWTPSQIFGISIVTRKKLKIHKINIPPTPSTVRCASIFHIRAGKTYTYYCDGGSMEGRFVNVIIPGNMKTLTLCEVEVYGAPAVEPLQDVALWKPTHQCCTWFDGFSVNAVSGRRGGIYGAGRCSKASSSNPWWRVDLLAEHNVSAVTITNIRDSLSSEIEGAEIWIGNFGYKTPNTRCGDISSTSLSYTFDCGGMQGRYVIVSIQGLKTLTLCGVEVFATLAGTVLEL
ncbi:hypothetical protein F7725_004743 [Dissostichus mawsoni]|uniref:Fucolectin tachylectin-4 pentraxin-1 domain-containing protein n=1 Tax=Dissostichus mawsoni TaxID=36200 RepID=A0A7J5XL46_DISMA|nr:hypothetical protein F7725_004743 [Dissostichus mawsoni]